MVRQGIFHDSPTGLDRLEFRRRLWGTQDAVARGVGSLVTPSFRRRSTFFTERVQLRF